MLNALVDQTLLTIKVMWVKRYSSYSFFRYKFKLVDGFRMRLLLAQGFFWIVRIFPARFHELLTGLGLFLHLMCCDFDPKMSGLKGVLIHRVVCCAVILGLLTKFDVSGSSDNHLMMILRRFINKPLNDLFILNVQFSMDYFSQIGL